MPPHPRQGHRWNDHRRDPDLATRPSSMIYKTRPGGRPPPSSAPGSAAVRVAARPWRLLLVAVTGPAGAAAAVRPATGPPVGSAGPRGAGWSPGPGPGAPPGPASAPPAPRPP